MFNIFKMKKYPENSSLAKKIVLPAVILSLLASTATQIAFTQTANAQAANPTPTYTLLEPLPCIPSSTVNCGTAGQTIKTVNINQYTQYAFNLFIALAAVAAVVMMTIGGIEYMTSVSVGGKAQGLKKVSNAIWGLVLVLCAYLILKTVNPQLVNVSGALVPTISPNTSNVNPNSLLNNY